MKSRKRKNFKLILIIALLVIPVILLNINKIYDITYGMLEPVIRPVKQTSTDLVQATSSRYSETNVTRKLYKDFNKIGSDATTTREQAISYEDVNRNVNLFMAEKGILPWKKYDSITGYFNNTRDEEKQKLYRNGASQDTILESWEVPGANNTDVSNVPSTLFASTTNNFGKEVGDIVATSRTIARYTYGGLRTDMSVGISYILAHTKTTDFDVDKVQQALWLLRYGANADISENITGANADEFILNVIGQEYVGLNRQSAIIAANLFEEAKALQDYMEEREALEASNNGQEIVDNMIRYNNNTSEIIENKYQTGQAGIVSYNTEDDEYFVGPFQFNYIRKVLVPENGANSEAINEDGRIIISGINSAKLYGIKKVDGAYKEVELTDWEFVYTDVVYDKTNQKAVRSYQIEAESNGDITPNMYPYPNETFYLKITSDDVEAITRFDFGMESLNATSEVYELNGTYSQVTWRLEKNDDAYYISSEESSTRPKASKLYQVKSAKIESESKTISVALGYERQGYGIYSGICIPLTMNIAGTVWEDGTEVREKNNELDATYVSQTEKGVEGVVVYLRDANDNLVQTTTTNALGKYELNYVKVGKKYYITFEYDGMKYKPTQPLGGNASVDHYRENMIGFRNMSHAVEDEAERIAFNESFYEITENTAIGLNNAKQDVSYTYERHKETENSAMGAVAKVQEFPINASTLTAGITYPLHSNYIITSISNQTMIGIDKNQAGLDNSYYLIGINHENEFYYVTTSNENEKPVSSKGTKFAKSADCLNNINLGLVERDSSDLAIKNDITQTIYTLNELVSNSTINSVGAKLNLGFDVADRKNNYYYINYVKELGYDEYSWRSSYMDNKKLLENDELQLYVQYKLTVKNQSNLLSSYLTEIVDYYDNELYYPVKEADNPDKPNNQVWQYYDKNINYTDGKEDENGYADVIMPQLTRYTSWAIKNNGQDDKQELGQVEWTDSSRYGEKNKARYLNKMYTTSLEKVRLGPGESVDIFIIFKVERTTVAGKEGLYIINDNNDIGKQNIAEINGYRSYNYNGTVGGRVDKDSNPGNSSINQDANPGNSALDNLMTYEDDIDSAPYLRVITNPKDNGKGISGYVWDDSRENGLGITLPNNQIVGNGIIDRNLNDGAIENFVNNVQVELIRMEYDKETGEYIEVGFADDYEERSGNEIIKYTGPQAGATANSEYAITDGMYRFDNLIESGTYKIRFTYGTETQLKEIVNIKNVADSVKYNGQDYKSTEYGGPIDLSKIENPDTSISIVIDSSTSISEETLNNIKNTVDLLNTQIDELNENIDVSIAHYAQYATVVDNVRQITSFPGDNLAEGIQLGLNTLNKEKENGLYAGNRIMVVFSDGYANEVEDKVKPLIQRALNAGVKIIAVGIEGANPDTFSVTAEESQVIYYNLANDGKYTTDKLYYLINEYIMRHLILIKDRSHATDYLEDTTIITDTKSKYATGRLQVMQYSQKMTSQNAETLSTAYINALENGSEWSRAIRKLAEHTQMTADSYLVNINFEDNVGVTNELNLGLQEIPKSQIEVNDQIDDIIVILSDNQEIISLRDEMTQNVQIIPESIYSIYLDEELMQGAKIEVVYKISVSNISEVDSLWIYLRHADFETKKHFYEELYKTLYNEDFAVSDDMQEEKFDELLFNAIPIRVTRLYNYNDNLVFRAEENNNWQIVNNTVETEGNSILRDGYDNILFANDSNDRAHMRDETVIWSTVNIPDVVERVSDRVDNYTVVETTSFKDIELYPTISTLVRDNVETSSLTTFIKYSKTLSAQDMDNKNALQYTNYTEINATEGITGRRDYLGAVGDYAPGNPDIQRDTSASEEIIILPPFGAQQIKYALIIAVAGILAIGIVITRKILNRGQK